MAYGTHYTITFKNRRQNDVYRIEINEKDYVGDGIFLTGAENPISVAYPEADNLLDPIKALEMTISFITDGSVSLLDFYSEDEEKFRIDFYCQELNDATPVEQLLYSTFLVQQDCIEPMTDRKHVVTLKASDHLGILKEITLDAIFPDVYGKKSLWEIINYCLKGTGLYAHDSVLDLQLHLRTFCNLFETSTDARDDDDTNDPLRETFVHTGMFQNSDGTYQNCYEVLEKVLTDYHAMICQAEGFWNVVRRPEYKYFTDGAILGSDYNFNGSSTDIAATTLSPLTDIGKDGTFYPILEDQLSSIQRPFKFAKTTFNYEQPVNLIKNSDLQLPNGATPYDTTTDGDLRYDDYDLATYFPDWVQRDGDASYLEVVTNTVTESEVERYIITPSPDDTARGVQFNPIPVSKYDVIDFSCQYKTMTDTDDMLNFGVRFLLITGGTTSYNLIDFPPILTSDKPGLVWDDFTPTSDWDIWNGVHDFISDSDADDIDTTEWLNYSLSGFLTASRRTLPQIPEDGMLLIQVMGTNTFSTSNNQTTAWKDITLTITNFLNENNKIIGQTHLDEQVINAKNNYDEEIYLDDSPRHTIGGTLFTDAITNFVADIGNELFTRTFKWSRPGFDESKRLGEILMQERLLSQYIARTIGEGTFANIRYFDDDDIRFVSILNLFSITLADDRFTDRFFLLNNVTFDYMNCQFNGKVVELFREGEAESGVILETDAEATTYATTGVSRPIKFTTATTEIDFSTDVNLLVWTYSGITAPVEIELNIVGIWDATDVPATLNLKVNGVVVDSYSIGDGNPPNSFTANLTYNVTMESGDTVSASVDWVGAAAYSLQIDSGSYLKVTRFLFDNTYTFKYLYEQT